jgi:hypothetical protein
MPPPLPRRSDWVFSLISPSRISLPRLSCRVGLRIVLFEVCSAFTHVAACTLAPSPYVVTAIRGLQTFRRLHACPDCFRRELSPGGSRTHWKAPPLHGARSKVTFAEYCERRLGAKSRLYGWTRTERFCLRSPPRAFMPSWNAQYDRHVRPVFASCRNSANVGSSTCPGRACSRAIRAWFPA